MKKIFKDREFEVTIPPNKDFLWDEAGSWLKTQDLTDLVGMDIGAHHGFFSLQAIAAGASKISCFEASSSNVEMLRKHITTNQLDEQIQIHHLAITGHTGDSLRLRKAGSNDGQQSLVFKSSFPDTTIVTTLSLAEAINKVASLYGRVDFIKIDTEGSEWSMFSEDQYPYLTDALQSVKLMEVELHPMTNSEYYDIGNWLGNEVPLLQAFLESVGFNVIRGGEHSGCFCCTR